MTKNLNIVVDLCWYWCPLEKSQEPSAPVCSYCVSSSSQPSPHCNHKASVTQHDVHNIGSNEKEGLKTCKDSPFALPTK